MDNKNFNLQNFIVSAIIIGAVLIIGIYVTSNIGYTTQSFSTPANVTNEEGSINSSGYTLTASSVNGFSNPVIISAINRTDGAAIVIAGNISVTSTGIVTNLTDFYWNNATFNYTYTWTAPTNASIAAGNVTTALSTGTSWISILIVVGFAIIILSMLTSGLGKVASEKAETPFY
jgi:hypothetical protein